MFFTKVGRFLAYVIGFFALLRIILAILFVNGIFPPQALSRFLGTHTPGHAIDNATYVLAVCIIVGILTEISATLRNKS